MKKIVDKNGTPLRNGDVIDINQTVNGTSEFYIMRTEPLDVRYNYNRQRKYEYDASALLSPSRLTGEIDFIILNPF